MRISEMRNDTSAYPLQKCRKMQKRTKLCLSSQKPMYSYFVTSHQSILTISNDVDTGVQNICLFPGTGFALFS